MDQQRVEYDFRGHNLSIILIFRLVCFVNTVLYDLIYAVMQSSAFKWIELIRVFYLSFKNSLTIHEPNCLSKHR